VTERRGKIDETRLDERPSLKSTALSRLRNATRVREVERQGKRSRALRRKGNDSTAQSATDCTQSRDEKQKRRPIKTHLIPVTVNVHIARYTGALIPRRRPWALRHASTSAEDKRLLATRSAPQQCR
jgi:hypothetical protein